MSVPTIMLSSACIDKCKIDEAELKKGKLDSTSKALIGATIADILIVIGTVTAGVLAMLGILPLPAAAAYALIGVGGAVAVAWIISNIISIATKKGANIITLKDIFAALFKCGDDSKKTKVKTPEKTETTAAT